MLVSSCYIHNMKDVQNEIYADKYQRITKLSLFLPPAVISLLFSFFAFRTIANDLGDGGFIIKDSLGSFLDQVLLFPVTVLTQFSDGLAFIIAFEVSIVAGPLIVFIFWFLILVIISIFIQKVFNSQRFLLRNGLGLILLVLFIFSFFISYSSAEDKIAYCLNGGADETFIRGIEIIPPPVPGFKSSYKPVRKTDKEFGESAIKTCIFGVAVGEIKSLGIPESDYDEYIDGLISLCQNIGKDKFVILQSGETIDIYQDKYCKTVVSEIISELR